MSQVSTEVIKDLRAKTGVSIMQCKKALEEAGGDPEKARIILQKKSKETASKKAERTLGSGVVQAYIHNTRSLGAMVELACETDFVANNEEFQALAYDIAMHIAAENPQYLKKEDIPEADWQQAKETFAGELTNTPQEKHEQILQGKLNSYFQGFVLLEQPFIKNQEVTIGNLIEQAVQKFGENTSVTRFTRFSIN